MRKINIINNYYCDYNDNNYRNSFLNRMTVNKKPNIISKTLRLVSNRRANIKNNIYKDNFYYESKNIRKKLSEEKSGKNVYYNKEPYKKTINIYSNDNRMKEGNIFEELQNNKYLRPILGTTNINKKLLKCQIGEPIKNICSLSLRNYFSNIELPFQKCQSPQKQNINGIYDEDNIYSYNLNNRTVMDRFNINLNNEYSPSNDNLENITYQGKNNSNSFFYREEDNNNDYNNYLLRYSENNIKKYTSNKLSKKNNEKYFYYDNKKEKNKKFINNRSTKIYHKNVITIRTPITIINKDIYNNKFNMNLENINNANNNDKILLKIYKNKLVEEFIIVLNKFIFKYYNKIGHFFLNNLIKYKNKTKNKIYFRKKNSRTNIKKLSLNENNYEKKILINLHKNKSKITSNTITNFNNKSFSNEFQSSSITSNFRTNNIINKLDSSFVQSEHKQKIYYQSPEDSLTKCRNINIRKKVILHQKKNSCTKSKILYRSPNRSEAKENLGDIFIYKKKNMNNDNLYINKNNKINNLSYLNLNNNNYYNIVTNNKKGKIIDIDINLGKPVSIINDHSPLEELFIENSKPKLFKLNTLSSKLNNNKKKKSKTKSGSINKIKPPLRLKKFLEEDDDIDNNYIDNRTNSSMRKDNYNNNISLFFGHNTLENINNIKEINSENSKNKNEREHLFLRFNHFSLNDSNQKLKNLKNKRFRHLRIKSDISILLSKNKKNKNEDILKNSSISNIAIKKNKTNKLYINCTKFLERAFNRIIKKKVFLTIKKFKFLKDNTPI